MKRQLFAAASAAILALAAACTQGFAVFGSYLVRALGAPSPRDRLRATGAEYLRFALENPLDYRFIFMGAPEDARPPKPRRPTPPRPSRRR